PPKSTLQSRSKPESTWKTKRRAGQIAGRFSREANPERRLTEESQLGCRRLERLAGQIRPLADPGMATTNLEQRSDLLGENPLPGHARAPLRIIEPVPAQVSDASKYLLFAIWEMFLKPMLEQWR